MAKKAKKKAAKRQPACTARVWWPGPTRLYDAEVDCGAVPLSGKQARSIVMAIERNCDLDDDPCLWSAIQAIRATFRVDDAFPLVRYKAPKND